jgi:hypothetical protein
VQVQRNEAPAAGDGDGGIIQRRAQRADDVGHGQLLRIEHDDDAAGRPSQRGRDGITRAERADRTDDLVDGSVRGRSTFGHDQHLRVRGAVCSQRRQHRPWIGSGVGDDHDGGRAAGRLVEARGHGVHRAVVDRALLDDIGGPAGLEVEGRAGIGDLPAGRFDARLERVGCDPVLPRPCRGAFLGQRDDVWRYG